MNPVFDRAVSEAIQTLEHLRALATLVERAASMIGDSLLGKRKLLVCGNGGSAADAADFATEFSCRFITDRKPYPAINLASCGSLLTATANDYDVTQIFARPVKAFGQEGDVLVAISTSGNSENILAAIEAGKSNGLHTISLLGRTGGRARGAAQIEMIVPGTATARIQEGQKFLLHSICELVEPRLLAREV